MPDTASAIAAEPTSRAGSTWKNGHTAGAAAPIAIATEASASSGS